MECGNAHYPPLTHEGAASGWNPTWTGSVWMWLELRKGGSHAEGQAKCGQLALHGALGML